MSYLEPKVKSYAIGSISMDETGVWHVHYLGPYKNIRTQEMEFGNWLESDSNLYQLLMKIEGRLSKSRGRYFKMIEEIVNAEQQSTPENSDSSSGRRDSSDDGDTVGGILPERF